MTRDNGSDPAIALIDVNFGPCDLKEGVKVAVTDPRYNGRNGVVKSIQKVEGMAAIYSVSLPTETGSDKAKVVQVYAQNLKVLYEESGIFEKLKVVSTLPNESVNWVTRRFTVGNPAQLLIPAKVPYNSAVRQFLGQNNYAEHHYRGLMPDVITAIYACLKEHKGQDTVTVKIAKLAE